MKWYEYLVNAKHEFRHRSQLINSYVDFINAKRLDTVPAYAFFINSISYDLIFVYGNKLSQVGFAVKWMKTINSVNPDNFNYADTYASLLYKANEKADALKWAEKAFAIAEKQHSIDDMNYEKNKMADIRQAKKIWNEKDYQ